MTRLRPPDAVYDARTKWLGKSGTVVREICEECDAELGIATRYTVTPDLLGGHTDVAHLTDDERKEIMRTLADSMQLELTREDQLRAEFYRLQREDPPSDRLEEVSAAIAESIQQTCTLIAAHDAVERGMGAGQYWLIKHSMSGYQQEGNYYRVLKTQRYPDGSPRLTSTDRGTGRRASDILAEFPHIDRSDYPLDAKAVGGEMVLLPAVIICPRCNASTWVPKPVPTPL